MLAIFSDVHVTDGSTAVNVDPAAFRLLGAEIAASAQRRGATEIHVVMLGDILDLVRTSWWHEQQVPPDRRPWGGVLDPATGMHRDAAAVERQFAAVLERVLATDAARALADTLRQLPWLGGQAPRVTYVIGNHERVLAVFESLRERVRAAFPGVRLAFAEGVTAPDYAVLARHGHEWDADCHGWEFLGRVLQKGRDVGRFDPDAARVMAMGEPVTAELMGGFVHRVRGALDPASADDARFLRDLQDVNNLRPMTDALSWVNWSTQGRSGRYTRLCRDALVASLRDLLDCTLARRWDELQPDLLVSGDITDHLQHGLEALEGSPDLHDVGRLLSRVARVSTVYRSVVAGKLDGFAKGARTEFGGAARGLQYVVYGHTHVARHDVFEAGLDGRVRMYVNAGTYLPLVERALDRRSFSRSHAMTLLFFYREDEDRDGRAGPGPTMELWDGIRRKTYG